MKFLNVEVYTELPLETVKPGETRRFWIHLVSNGLAQPIFIPVIVARGIEDGPILGLTAVVHGNELNGLKVVQQSFKDLDNQKLRGTLIGVPVVNTIAVHRFERHMPDGADLNRIMPGLEEGNSSEVFASRILNRIVRHMEYLLDLHTASFGRINSHYIRANLDDPVTARMAMLQNPDIILNTKGYAGTLRKAASAMGIKAITVEVGDPNRFQKGMIRSGVLGIHNVMADLNMIEEDIHEPDIEPVRCSDSYWIYADRGGILEVFPGVTDLIKKGDRIAVIKDVFGDTVKEYFAPEDGIVIGKEVHPINQTGGRILHLGKID
jgi:predicted deacylase